MEEDIKLVFNHVQVILLHNTTLLETLTYRIANLDDWTVVPHVGDLLIELKEYLRVYGRFATNYPEALGCLERYSRFKEFQAFLKTAESDPRCKGKPFGAFLIVPIQRVPRYIMLLEELQKHTPDTHPDHEDINAALEHLRRLATFVNQEMKRASTTPQLIRIYHQLEPKMTDLVAAHRSFVFEGACYQYLNDSSRSRYLFLFSDILLVTKRLKLKKKYEIKLHITLSRCRVDDRQDFSGWKLSAELRQMTKNAFQIHTPKKSLMFFAPDHPQKLKWVEHLSESIANSKQ